MKNPELQSPPAALAGIHQVPDGAHTSIVQRQQALRERFPVWAPCTLDAALGQAASSFPERPFVITDSRSWTYAQVAAWSEVA
jgi:non-ribosomal peptide synthetase component E (peptide arylation enzyme)